MDPISHRAEPPLMSDVLPELTQELKELLVKQDELELAAQVSVLRIVDRCRCGDDFCCTFYVQSKPRGGYGPDHRNVELDPKDGMLILDVVGDKIACVEVLFRDDIRQKLDAAI